MLILLFLVIFIIRMNTGFWCALIWKWSTTKFLIPFICIGTEALELITCWYCSFKTIIRYIEK